VEWVRSWHLPYTAILTNGRFAPEAAVGKPISDVDTPLFDDFRKSRQVAKARREAQARKNAVGAEGTVRVTATASLAPILHSIFQGFNFQGLDFKDSNSRSSSP
jgi:hypothetical protein